MKIFIHGLLSSSEGFKARFFRRTFPDMLTPDFSGDLDKRMAQLQRILMTGEDHILVGSSFGGLMAALYLCEHPHKVTKAILLAPALPFHAFAEHLPRPCNVPTIIFHGSKDTVVPLEPTRALAQRVFNNLTFHVVDDDHMLHHTVTSLDWKQLLSS